MKLNGFPRNLMGVLLVLCLASLLTGCCGELPPEVQRDLDNLWEQIQREFEREVQDAWEQAKEELIRQAREAAEAWLRDRLAPGGPCPEEVGTLAGKEVEWGITPEEMREAFCQAYRELGGESIIGAPINSVDYYGGNESLLAQEFTGGQHKRAVLTLHKYDERAYGIYGAWLDQYLSLGGPLVAGHPKNHVQRYLLISPAGCFPYVRYGLMQAFATLEGGGQYALMMGSGTESVRTVPPKFWEEYQRYGPKKLGYPISNLPLPKSEDLVLERVRRAGSQGYREIEEFVTHTLDQSVRVLLFQCGSIVYDDDMKAIETLAKQRLACSDSLVCWLAPWIPKANLHLHLGKLLEKLLYDVASGHDIDDCQCITFESVREANLGECIRIALTGVIKTYFEGLLTALKVILPLPGKAMVTVVKYFVEVEGSTNLPETTFVFVAREIASYTFPRLLGDLYGMEEFVAIPPAEVTGFAAKRLLDQTKGLIVTTTGNEGKHQPGGFCQAETTPSQTAILYNPYTHMVTALTTGAKCNLGTIYIIRYRANEYGQVFRQATPTWEGCAAVKVWVCSASGCGDPQDWGSAACGNGPSARP